MKSVLLIIPLSLDQIAESLRKLSAERQTAMTIAKLKRQELAALRNGRRTFSLEDLHEISEEIKNCEDIATLCELNFNRLNSIRIALETEETLGVAADLERAVGSQALGTS